LAKGHSPRVAFYGTNFLSAIIIIIIKKDISNNNKKKKEKKKKEGIVYSFAYEGVDCGCRFQILKNKIIRLDLVSGFFWILDNNLQCVRQLILVSTFSLSPVLSASHPPSR